MADNDRGLQLFHSLRRVSVELELSRGDFARQHGLHPTDLRALIQLLDAARAGHRATPGWLGQQLGLNSAGTTTLIDRLERLGHVSRTRDTSDRRKVFLAVTPEAERLGWSFFGPLIHAAVAGMGALTGAELATVQQFLDTMTDIAVAQRSAQAADGTGSRRAQAGRDDPGRGAIPA